MIEFSIDKQILLTSLGLMAGAVDKKQAFPVLANFFMDVQKQTLTVIATDLDIEIKAQLPLIQSSSSGSFTVPAKKIMDILKALDEKGTPNFSYESQYFLIASGLSKFKLATIPADDFPVFKDVPSLMSLKINRNQFIHLLYSTHFSLSIQEVRAYLGGLLLEVNSSSITAVATDGHRMAMNQLMIDANIPSQRVLLPRKTIVELLKILAFVSDEEILVDLAQDVIRVTTEQFTIQSRLIDTRFPSYAKAIPQSHNKWLRIPKDQLKRALSRIAILANEKSRAILLEIAPSKLTLIANNQEKEEARDTLDVETSEGSLKIAINVNYLLDVLTYIPDGDVTLSFGLENESILLEVSSDERFRYIIMPMKI